MANLQIGVAGNGTVTVGAGASVHSPASNTLTLGTNNSERLRVGSSGELGIAGANYGTSGQFLKSGGSGAAISWGDGGVTSDAQKNTVAGTNAGDDFSGTDAVQNTLMGYDAGTAITTGDGNTGVGF